MTNALAFAALGALAGAWHFGSLHWLSRLLLQPSAGRWPWRRIGLVQLLRLALLAAVCLWAVRHGALPLAMLALGVIAARVAWVAAVHRAIRRRA